MLRLSVGLVCALAAFLLPLRAHPQDSEGRRSLITRTTEPPEIDGVLDDPAWRAAAVMTDLRQYEPVAGAPASESCQVPFEKRWHEAAALLGIDVATISPEAGHA